MGDREPEAEHGHDDCREAGEPISFELALRARAAMQAKAEPACGGVRIRMVKDVQRPIVLSKDELEVIARCGVVDGDRQNLRDATPERLHCDSISLARRVNALTAWTRRANVVRIPSRPL
jgi:hypothetical protein